MDKNYKILIFFLCSAIVGIVNGIFGGGGGIICVPIFKKLLNFNDKQAHATAVLVMSIISIPTLIIYLSTLSFSLEQTLLVTFGSLIGGLIGIKLLNLFSNKTINILFIIVLLLSAVKMFI